MQRKSWGGFHQNKENYFLITTSRSQEGFQQNVMVRYFDRSIYCRPAHRRLSLQFCSSGFRPEILSAITLRGSRTKNIFLLQKRENLENKALWPRSRRMFTGCFTFNNNYQLFVVFKPSAQSILGRAASSSPPPPSPWFRIFATFLIFGEMFRKYLDTVMGSAVCFKISCPHLAN